jgi:primosomal protein N' (replication factor Y)
MKFVDVILPLPLEATFTYAVPPELENRVGVGYRVIVPFGAAKQYSGIVTRISDTPPQGEMKVKPVVDILEYHPILLPAQLRFWTWLADYYMCPLGDVYKAALPSGLKLASETSVSVQEDFDDWNRLTPKEMQVFELMQSGKAQSVRQLQKALKDSHVLTCVRALMEKGAVQVKETIDSSFRPRKEVHVRLASKYLTEDALNALLDTLERTPKRFQMITTYIELSGLSAALTLGNLKLIKEVSRRTLLEKSGTSAAVLLALKAKGIVELYDFETGRLRDSGITVVEQLPLTAPQQEAFDDIHKQWAAKPVCLLHGVTSSGKTEIYIRLIREALSQGRQVLYLLPEIALTTQITTRLRRIFGNEMGVYHSKFPDAERVEIWQKQLSDHPYGLILGVRSSLFLPFRNLGLVIVDEEHETSYKQQDPAPRYNARDAAIVLASLYKARTLLGTATPSIETYWNALHGKYGLVELSQRYGDMLLPKIEVADVKELLRTKQMRQPFSPQLEDEIRAALERKEQVILFQNRRGYTPVVECPTCGWTPTCQFCDVTLTYHHDQNRMVCHYCGNSFEVPRACPNCGETHLLSIGFGTEKIEEEVHKRFPGARTARLDLDTTRSRSSYERIIGDFAEGRTDILIGTQMVSKGLDFDNVHVVGILDADTMLTRPDFRSFERAFQMMAQVAGRAGRRGKRGYVILQTKRADYPIIKQVTANDYISMYNEQVEERRAFHYPPFYRLIYAYVKHRDYATVERAAALLGGAMRRRFGDRVLGPDKPAVSRIQMWNIRKVALKVERTASPAQVRRLLRQAADEIRNAVGGSSLQIYFDVDPL